MGKKEHQPFSGQRRALRIKLICDGITNNLPYSQVQQNLQSLSENLDSAIGDRSVLNVKRVLSLSPDVSELIETKKNSYEDTEEKHDLEFLHGEIGMLGVQIKSSIYGVLRFYKTIDEDYFRAKDILAQRKMIVLDGSLPDSTIQKNFIEQLQRIKEYHKTQA